MLMLAMLLQAGALPPLLADYAATAEGRFSSVAQHRADPRYDEVEARVVRVWPERTDGLWLYQEQAIVAAKDGPAPGRAKPYFQFVARVVVLEDGVLRRDNFRVKDGAKWLGVTTGDARLRALTEAELAPASCHNRIELVSAGHWIGRTESCANGYKGAAFMRNLSTATRDAYVNWDRGFDAAGRRVWGPEAGGYVFRRVE
jgi:hypothetical protein